MQLVKIKCNNCDAKIDVNLDDLQAFCPYCGQKLMIDFDQLAWILAEKEKEKHAADCEEHQTVRAKMTYDHESLEKEGESKHATMSSIVPWTILIIMAILFLVLHFGFVTREHKQRVTCLKELEVEIDDAIQSQDYDSALLKLNKLYLDDNYSSEESATWDKKRETYLKIIEEKQREIDLKDPDNIFMPSAASSFKGEKYVDVVDELTGLGFTNITTQVASVSPGWFDKKDTVEHILVGGKTDFSTEDYFNKDVPIIIYYYSK